MITNTQYMYIEGPPQLYISYASPEEIRQDQYQETLEAARDTYKVKINCSSVLTWT